MAVCMRWREMLRIGPGTELAVFGSFHSSTVCKDGRCAAC